MRKASMLLLMAVLPGLAYAEQDPGVVITCRNIKGVALVAGEDGAISTSPDGFSGFTLRFILRGHTLTALWDEIAYDNEVVRLRSASSLSANMPTSRPSAWESPHTRPRGRVLHPRSHTGSARSLTIRRRATRHKDESENPGHWRRSVRGRLRELAARYAAA
jgi:hypothetical protein